MPIMKPAAPKPATAVAPNKNSAATPASKDLEKSGEDTLELLESGSSKGDQPAKGFDPYNSGAFNVRDTWSKVIRK
jgi:hypothetical protein